MYVRDSLVMANYGMDQYLTKIISDALSNPNQIPSVNPDNPQSDAVTPTEQYQISKTEYELFREKYNISRNDS